MREPPGAAVSATPAQSGQFSQSGTRRMFRSLSSKRAVEAEG
ncbi:hypothetical protein [Tropicimonas sp. IMCC34011]|nr:hypothetical protein [Tropicimonas sp. IMCC34011]